MGGGWNHNNGQGQLTQHQPAQRGAGENNEDQNGQENAIPQNWPQTQSHQQCEGGPPMCYKCRGWGISTIIALVPRITPNMDR